MHDKACTRYVGRRETAGGQALTVLNLDSVPPQEVLDEIRKDPDITNVRIAKL